MTLCLLICSHTRKKRGGGMKKNEKKKLAGRKIEAAE